MKTKTLVILASMAASSGTSFAQSARENSFEQIERGRALTVLGDCAACHSLPRKPPFSGGVEINTPFGKLIGANITPDPATGIGKYNEEDFQRVMSDGIARGGYHLYAAMPFTAYTKVSREDTAAIWAYLQTIDPVSNEIETNQLPFPFSVRTSLYAWNFLNFTRGEFQKDEQKTEEWNRGAYIVQGLGHCGTCHTPKNFLGGDKTGEQLMGAVVEHWYAPRIIADARKGIGSWTTDDIVEYLKTGVNRFDTASGPMAEEIENSSQHWPEADLRAVATYLKDSGIVPESERTPINALDPRMLSGAAIYTDRCSACHTPSGEGVKGLFPKLSNAPLVNGDDATSMMRVVLAGSVAKGAMSSPTGPAMPSFGWNLSDQQLANVLTFVRNSWGNAAPPVSDADVESLREQLLQ